MSDYYFQRVKSQSSYYQPQPTLDIYSIIFCITIAVVLSAAINYVKSLYEQHRYKDLLDSVNFLSVQNATLRDEVKELKHKQLFHEATFEVMKRRKSTNSLPGSPVKQSSFGPIFDLKSNGPISALLPEESSQVFPLLNRRIGYIGNIALVLPKMDSISFNLVVDEYTLIDCLHVLSDSSNKSSRIVQQAEFVLCPVKKQSVAGQITDIANLSQELQLQDKNVYSEDGVRYFQPYNHKNVISFDKPSYELVEELMMACANLILSNKVLKSLSLQVQLIGNEAMQVNKKQLLPLCVALKDSVSLLRLKLHGIRFTEEASAALSEAVEASQLEEMHLSSHLNSNVGMKEKHWETKIEQN